MKLNLTFRKIIRKT